MALGAAMNQRHQELYISTERSEEPSNLLMKNPTADLSRAITAAYSAEVLYVISFHFSSPDSQYRSFLLFGLQMPEKLKKMLVKHQFRM